MVISFQITKYATKMGGGKGGKYKAFRMSYLSLRIKSFIFIQPSVLPAM